MHAFMTVPTALICTLSIVACCITPIGLAYAQESDATSSADAYSGMSIGANGEAIGKSGQIVAMDADLLVVDLSWGAMKIPWHVRTTYNTYLLGPEGKRIGPSQFQVGHYVNFDGPVDPTATVPTVIADAVRDISLTASSSATTTAPTSAPSIASTTARSLSSAGWIYLFISTLSPLDAIALFAM